MLVIRRRAGEAVLIGDDVELEILEITNSQVKLGIRAPREVTVLRKEIRLTAAENQAAARVNPAETMEKLRGQLAPAKNTPQLT
jgi:carbon storage regulator